MSLAVPTEPGVVLRPLTRAQYDRLVDAGALDDEPVELLEGALVEVSPQGGRHAAVITRLTALLVRGLPETYEVRPAVPFAAGDLSEPEPDVAVVPRGGYESDHPREAALVVEVASSSRAKDLGVKARVYAAAGVPVYWVVDLVQDVVHVHTDPSAQGYARRTERAFGEPMDVLGVRVVLAELLGP